MTPVALSIREATAEDIPTMQRIRLSVKENRLDDPTRISEKSYGPFLHARSVWVAEIDAHVAGFAIVDAGTHNVWAIFVDPRLEGRGVGRALHERLLQWSLAKGLGRLWLTTTPGTRAEQFYRTLGWSDSGLTSTGEIRFERLL